MLQHILALVMLLSSFQVTAGAEAATSAETGRAQVFAVREIFDSAVAYEPVFSARAIDEATFERIDGVSWKPECPVPIVDLRLLNVTYMDFDGRVREGELICHRLVAEDLRSIFSELYEAGFPIASLRLIDDYAADDLLSMEDNNTSSFNYRTISGSESLSRHAYGLAIDINPVQNPYVEGGGGYVSPGAGREYLDRGDARPGMVIPGNAAHKAFVSRGWTWGGDWKYQTDYQHFQKSAPLGDS